MASAGLLACIALTACAAPADNSMSSQEQNAGQESTLKGTEVISITNSDIPFPTPADQPWPENSAKRIVTLANGSGEVVVALGGAERIVGRDETSNAPEIDQVPVVTKAHSVSAEQVLALSPDVVLIDATTSPAEAIQQIRDAGVTVVEVPEAWSRTEVADKIQAIGAAIGAPESAIEFALTNSMGSQSQLFSVGNRVAFLYLRGTSAIYLLGGVGSGADSLIADSGAVDVGAEAGMASFTPLTAEELVNLNPDTLLVMEKGLESVGGIDGLLALPGIAQTDAAKTRHVVAVDDTLLLSFGPRTGALIDTLHDSWKKLS
jgi:iron complex transport system substrate-binding protein